MADRATILVEFSSTGGVKQQEIPNGQAITAFGQYVANGVPLVQLWVMAPDGWGQSVVIMRSSETGRVWAVYIFDQPTG